MSESEAKLQKVSAASDNGHGRQWGLGRLFVQIDGAKPRINTKAVFVLIAVLFGFVGVIGMFQKKSQTVTGKSSINLDLPAEQNEQVAEVSVSAYSFGSTPRSHQRSGGGANSYKTSASSLTVTRRNPGGKIPPGVTARAKLMTGASNGFVKAMLLEDLVPYGETLLPAGTALVGAAQSSTERLAINFTKAVLPDGSVQDISAVACDGQDKMPGLKGENVRGQALSLAGAVGLNFAGGMAMGMQTSSASDEPKNPTVKDGLLSGAAVAALERGREISQDLKSEEPIIEVEEQTEFYVLFMGAR